MRFQNLSILLISLPLSTGGAQDTVSRPPPLVQQHQDVLSAAIDNQPLPRVVDALNRLSPSGCALSGYIIDQAETTVTASFQGLPLLQGLRRILRGYNYLLSCDPDQAHGISLKLLRRVKSGEAILQRLNVLLEHDDIVALTDTLAEALSYPDKAVNREALRLLNLLEEAMAAEQLDDPVRRN